MKRIIILFIYFCFTSCLKIDCEELKKAHENEECKIVVQEAPMRSSWFKVKGYNPETKENCECKSVNRWWSQFSEEIEIGDTIIKRKGELTFNIHKKDSTISHHWICEGKTY